MRSAAVAAREQFGDEQRCTEFTTDHGLDATEDSDVFGAAVCPQCGDEDPWDERAAYVFNEDDLPFVFPYEVYEDHSELWRTFCHQYFGVSELTEADTTGLRRLPESEVLRM